jgi:hypothetical protein
VRSLIAFAFLCIAHSTFAQSVFSIKEVIRKGGDYKFPIIVSTQRPAIANKTNTIIQQGLGADPTLKNPFDSLQNEDEYYYRVGTINDRIISLIAGGAHSGCGYHVSETAYNIDSRTGESIAFDKLFITAAKPKLMAKIFNAWKSKLAALRKGGNERYKECIEDLDQRTSFTEQDIRKMLVTDTGIKFWAGQCLDGSESAYDETVGPHEFSYADLLPVLTPYAFSLFIDQTSSAPLQTLLGGKIDGKYPITLVLLPASNNNFNGILSYDRVGDPLKITGTMVGNDLVFHEIDPSSGANLSNISVKWNGTKLDGVFINLKSNKQMTFVASTK